MKKILSCILAAVMLAFGLTSCSILGGAGGDSQGAGNSTNHPTNTIEFVNTEVVMEIGESVQLEVTTSKKNAPVFWSIRDAEIASVSDKGLITALAAGETGWHWSNGGLCGWSQPLCGLPDQPGDVLLQGCQGGSGLCQRCGLEDCPKRLWCPGG